MDNNQRNTIALVNSSISACLNHRRKPTPQTVLPNYILNVTHPPSAYLSASNIKRVFGLPSSLRSWISILHTHPFIRYSDATELIRSEVLRLVWRVLNVWCWFSSVPNQTHDIEELVPTLTEDLGDITQFDVHEIFEGLDQYKENIFNFNPITHQSYSDDASITRLEGLEHIGKAAKHAALESKYQIHLDTPTPELRTVNDKGKVLSVEKFPSGSNLHNLPTIYPPPPKPTPGIVIPITPILYMWNDDNILEISQVRNVVWNFREDTEVSNIRWYQDQIITPTGNIVTVGTVPTGALQPPIVAGPVSAQYDVSKSIFQIITSQPRYDPAINYKIQGVYSGIEADVGLISIDGLYVPFADMARVGPNQGYFEKSVGLAIMTVVITIMRAQRLTTYNENDLLALLKLMSSSLHGTTDEILQIDQIDAYFVAFPMFELEVDGNRSIPMCEYGYSDIISKAQHWNWVGFFFQVLANARNDVETSNGWTLAEKPFVSFLSEILIAFQATPYQTTTSVTFDTQTGYYGPFPPAVLGNMSNPTGIALDVVTANGLIAVLTLCSMRAMH